MAVGKVKLALNWNSFLLLVIPGCIFLGSSFGVTGIAVSLVTLQIVLLPGHWLFLLNKSVGISAESFFSSLARPLIAAIIAGFVTWLVVVQLASFVYLLQIGAGLLAGSISYAVAAYVLNPTFRGLLQGKFSLE